MSLREKTIRAFAWAGSAKAVTQAVSWAISILLARLLVPSDFGLVAMAWTFVGLLEQINQLGIGAAIIQRADMEEEDLQTLFWIALTAGISLYVVAYMGAGPLAAFFGNNRLVEVIRLLALTMVLSALSTVPFNLLTKDLAFGKRSKAEVLSVLAGGTVSIALALQGYGVMSLVMGTLCQQVVLTATVWVMAGWRPRWCFGPDRVGSAFRFGLSVMATRMIWYLHSSADTVIVGKWLGDRLLGFYSMSGQLSTLPVQKISTIVNQVAFPVFSQLQHDLPKLRTYFLTITRFVALITFPLMIALVVIAEPLVRLILTEKWLPVVDIFQILCVIGVIKSVDTIIPNMLMARGRADVLLTYNVAILLVLPAAFFLGASYGLLGVAYAWVVAYPMLLLYLYRIGLAELGLSVTDYLKNLAPAILAAVAMGTGMAAFRLVDSALWGSHLWVTVVGATLVGIIACAGALVLFQRDMTAEVKGLVGSLRSPQPLAESPR